MALKLGPTALSKLYLGAAEATKAYLGATEVFSSGGVPWTPADLGALLALWLDAEDTATITLNGSDVAQWDDKSGNNRHATQSTAANQPEYLATGFSGKPVISFTKVTADHLVTPTIADNSIAGGRSITVIQLIKPRTGWAGTFQAPIGTRSDGGSWWSFMRTAATNEFGFHGAAQYWTGSDLNADASIMVDVVSGGNTLDVFRNGSQIGTPSLAIAPFTAAATAMMYIGAGSITTAGEAYEGDVMEVIFLTSAISLANRQLVEGYLAWKWGLVGNLPSDHPYKWDGTLFGWINITDTDVRTYITAVETADNASLESAVMVAINDFVVGCKADGIWTALRSSCILAGARTLDGALVPLVGAAPTNFNFVSGDYIRAGLKGNGSTKYLDTNTNNNTTGLNDVHLSYLTTGAAANGSIGVGSGGTSGSTGITGVSTRNRNSSSTGLSPTSNLLTGSARQLSTEFESRSGGVTTTALTASQTLIDGNIYVFARNGLPAAEQFTTARLFFYSFGDYLDLALLDARVVTLLNAYAAAIP